MSTLFDVSSWLTRLPFDLKPRLCAGTAYGCCQPQRLGRQREGIQLQDQWYCSAACFERGLLLGLRRLRRLKFRRSVTHRLPIGLLLLSRGAITQAQLSAALSSQRERGSGKLGEWLLVTGATEEYEITKALSEQWGCPVLKACSPDVTIAAMMPMTLLHSHRVAPFHFAAPTRTLYLAFSEHVSYALMTAVESMLDCRTEPCLTTTSEMDRNLSELRRLMPVREVVFEAVKSDIEIAATVRSYALECSATGARICNCGDFTWVRLFAKQSQDVLFRISEHEKSGIEEHVVAEWPTARAPQ